LYELQQGANEAKIVEQAKKLRMPLPEKIANKPKLHIGLDIYWRAFWECSTDRGIGMAEGPIPWSVMDRWALRYGIEGDDFDRFVLLLKAMDLAYIEERTKSNKKHMDRAMTSKESLTKSSSVSRKGAVRTRSKM
jgi:hypothetical protein